MAAMTAASGQENVSVEDGALRIDRMMAINSDADIVAVRAAGVERLA